VQNHKKIAAPDKETFYKILLVRLEGLLSSEEDWLANLANSSALLFENLDDINWAGFYLLKNNELVLGPFQGRTACTRIRVGNGVCGTAAQKREMQVVKNVHDFPGHIACDSASNSEIVIPIIKEDKLAGVLDIDSPIFERFDETDAAYLQKFVDKLNPNLIYTVNYTAGYSTIPSDIKTATMMLAASYAKSIENGTVGSVDSAGVSKFKFGKFEESYFSPGGKQSSCCFNIRRNCRIASGIVYGVNKIRIEFINEFYSSFF
jgi:GAF domain-containing protein